MVSRRERMVMRAYLSPALHQRCIGAESMRSFDLISYRFLVGEAVLASIMLDRSGKPIEEPAVAISLKNSAKCGSIRRRRRSDPF
jgi:hypothetical protein